MSRRKTIDRPTPMRSLAEDVLVFMESNPGKPWYVEDIAVSTGWPTHSVRVAMGYLVSFRVECARTAPGTFTWTD